MKWWKSYVVVTIVLGLVGCSGTSTTTSAVDTPEMAQASTDLKEVSQMEQCTLEVTGMTCGGCSSSVTKALEKTPGVTSAKVSLEEGLGKTIAWFREHIRDYKASAYVT